MVVYPVTENFAAEIADVSNLDPEEAIWGEQSRRRMFEMGNRLWHTDSSFRRLPAKGSLLYARSIPPVGGETEFADMRAASDVLPDEMKSRLRGLVAEHAIMYSRRLPGFTDFSDEENEQPPPVPQIVVRRPRNMQRATVSDVAPTCEQEGIAVPMVA